MAPPPAAQSLSCPCPAPPPKPGLSLYPFPTNTRSSFTPRRPLGACVSVCLSVCPTCPRPTLGPGQGWGCSRDWEPLPTYVATSPPHPFHHVRGCSMFYMFLNENLKTTAPPAHPDRGSLRGHPVAPESPTPLPHRPQEPFFKLEPGARLCHAPSPSRPGPRADVVCRDCGMESPLTPV